MVLDKYGRADNKRIKNFAEEFEEEIEENEDLVELALLAAWGDVTERFKDQMEEIMSDLVDDAEYAIEENDAELESLRSEMR